MRRSAPGSSSRVRSAYADLPRSTSGEEVQAGIGALRLTGLATSVACLLLHRRSSSCCGRSPRSWSRRRSIWLSVLNATLCTFAPVLMVMMAIERIGATVDGTDRHDRAALDDPDGRRDPRRAVHCDGSPPEPYSCSAGIWLLGQMEMKRMEMNRWTSASERQMGARVRGEQGPRQGLRDGAGAGGRERGRSLRAVKRRSPRRPAELRALGRAEVRSVAGRHHDRRLAAGGRARRLSAGRHPRQQRRRAAPG